jgi:hypothetical protein
MYDKFQLLAGTAEFPVGVVGNPQTFDYELVDLRGDVNDWQDPSVPTSVRQVAPQQLL